MNENPPYGPLILDIRKRVFSYVENFRVTFSINHAPDFDINLEIFKRQSSDLEVL